MLVSLSCSTPVERLRCALHRHFDDGVRSLCPQCADWRWQEASNRRKQEATTLPSLGGRKGDLSSSLLQWNQVLLLDSSVRSAHRRPSRSPSSGGGREEENGQGAGAGAALAMEQEDGEGEDSAWFRPLEHLNVTLWTSSKGKKKAVIHRAEVRLCRWLRAAGPGRRFCLALVLLGAAFVWRPVLSVLTVCPHRVSTVVVV